MEGERENGGVVVVEGRIVGGEARLVLRITEMEEEEEAETRWK